MTIINDNHTQVESMEDIINDIRAVLPKEEDMYKLADLFKIFGDSTRMKILMGLEDREMCVAHISELVEMSQSATSHQLRILKENKLVKARRDGKQIFYSLDDEHVNLILKKGLEHIKE